MIWTRIRVGILGFPRFLDLFFVIRNMIKQILGKVSKKQSKFSKNQESLATQNSNSRKLSNSDISAPLNPRFHTNAANLRNGGHVSVSYESLPSFRDVPSNEKQNLFIKKVIMCSVIFDCTDPTKNLKEKEIKHQTLLELVDIMVSSNVKFTESVMQEFVKMISANLFRELTPQPRDCRILNSYDLEEEEQSTNPSWPHLQIVYELLLRFITSPEADAKKFIDHYFVLKLLDLFDSDDPREREYLKTILHRVYGKFMVHRPFIRKSINNIFYKFVLETEKHNGVAELLDILGCIVNGFALPLKEEHKLFLYRALIPLHKPKCLAMYHQQLSYCVTQFVEKDCKLADMVIRGLLKYWPVTNSSKEIMFLGELEEVLEATQQPQFHRCMVPLFKQIARCLNSLHFQVAERALFFWSNDHIETLMRHNLKVILPIIFPALERNWRYHWNPAVHSLTLNVRKILFDLDPELFNECLLNFQEDEMNEEKIQSRRESTWKHLEEIAADKASSNEAVLVN